MGDNLPVVQSTPAENTGEIDSSSIKYKSSKSNILTWQALFLLGGGLFLIYFYSFMTGYPPYFFDVSGEVGYTLFYVVENIIGPLGVLLVVWSIALFISKLLKNLPRSNMQFPQEDLNAL